jgi:hypothetical protein
MVSSGSASIACAALALVAAFGCSRDAGRTIVATPAARAVRVADQLLVGCRYRFTQWTGGNNLQYMLDILFNRKQQAPGSRVQPMCILHDYDDRVFSGGLLKQTRQQQLCVIGAYLADHLGGQIIIGQVKGLDRI